MNEANQPTNQRLISMISEYKKSLLEMRGIISDGSRHHQSISSSGSQSINHRRSAASYGCRHCYYETPASISARAHHIRMQEATHIMQTTGSAVYRPSYACLLACWILLLLLPCCCSCCCCCSSTIANIYTDSSFRACSLRMIRISAS